ncbi:MAG: efflux RND transporter permease subunit [Verrucomicrobia bacterium]|nr:efflux RND transporter permease subunit [Verrucomicrobiota bacterium]
MKFTDIFVKRPVLATVVNLIVLIAGLQALNSINVRQYPKSDLAVVQVNTAYVGASADLVRGFVTTPLERIIASADGIDYIESSSSQSLSSISVHLKLNYDTNAALAQIQAKIAQVRNDLPPEAEAPTIQVITTDDRIASMYLSFYSKDLDANQITDYLTRVVQPKLTAVNGVQRADILGARTFAMRAWLKSERMAALGISPADVRRVLGANNYLAALGSTKGSMITVNLTANTDLRTAEEFRQLVIKQANNTIVRLGDIADVVLGAETYDADVRFDGQLATFMGVWVLPTANSLDVIKRVRAVVPEIEAALPAGMKVGVPYDSTRYIQDALREVVKTLAETVLIVVVVIFLFLGSLRSVIIPVVAIPLSLVGAVAMMWALGFTLNLLTLLAIVLAVGLVVDDAIVVVENVERHLGEGDSPMEAALKGARELVGPVIAMSITLAAVYLPIGLQGGLTGTLFREFAFTLAGAVLISGFVALTLSPMMSARMLREGDSHRGFAARVNFTLDKARSWYTSMLEGSLKYRPVTVTVWIVVCLLAFPLWLLSGQEQAPKEDQGVIFAVVQAAPNSTIEQTTLFTEKIFNVFKSFPETGNTFQITQPTGGFSGMVTKPWSERKRSTAMIFPEVTAKIAEVPGVRAIPLLPDALPGGGAFPYEFILASTLDAKQLYEVAQKLVAGAMKSGNFFFVDTDVKFDLPQSEIVFDRDKVAALGLNLQQVGADLGTLLGGNYVNRFSIDGRSYKVIPQVKRGERLTTEQLKDLYVSGPNGRLVALSTFATLRDTVEPRSLNRFQQLNAVRIQGVHKPWLPLDTVLRQMEDEARAILPSGTFIDYAGEARQLRREGGGFGATLLMAGILIYLVLAAQFESWRDPFIILLGSAPLALTGALVFSFLGFTTLNVYSKVGLVTLIGLVSKNGILIVEFANSIMEERGISRLEAVIEAAATRLRPILMTTAATIAGHFPLILATGPGAGARNSIGYMLVSGMFIGTLFTLFVVPTIYTFIARDRSHAARAKEGEQPAPKAAREELVTA